MSTDHVPIEHWIQLAKDTANWWRERMIEDQEISPPEVVIYLSDPPESVPLNNACCALHAEERIQEGVKAFGGKYLIRMAGVTREEAVMSHDGSLLPLNACKGMMVSLRTSADPTPLWATFCEITKDGPQPLEHAADGEWTWEAS